MADDGFVTTRVQGLSKLSRALRNAGVKVEDLKEANERTGLVVVRAAQPITPRASGDLAGSIRPGRRQSGVVVRAGGGRVRYAKFVEYGTRKMAPRPYLYRAARDSEPQWLKVYEAEIRRLVNGIEASADGTGD